MVEAKPSLKSHSVTEYYPSPLNPWSFVRAVIPVGQALDDPLVVYQLRRRQRTGSHPWMLVVLAYLALIIEILYLIIVLNYDSVEPQNLTELLGEMLTILAGVLSVGTIYGHWRLMLAVFSRAAQVVTERRLRGDWELIAITPMPKARWLRSQLIGLGWQVWPLVRNLIIIQTVLMFIFSGALLYGLYDNRQNETYPNDEYYYPLPVYMLLASPMLLAVILEPVMTVAVLAALSFYVSTLSKHPAMAMLYNFLGIFFIRTLIMAVLIYSSLFFAFFFFTFSPDNNFGSMDGSSFFGFLLSSCIFIPLSSFFVEWFPAIGAAALVGELSTLVHVLLYLTILCAGLTTYIATPLLIIQSLASRAVRRLQMRER